MSEENMLLIFPQKRIKPFDGMEITADVWEQAHFNHRQELQAHNLFFHGAGILTGLEVVASDPVDQMVYILPGIAVDNRGRTIVLSDPIAYDLGNEVEGPLFLTITYRENEQTPPAGLPDEAPRYVEKEFLLTARPSLPEAPAVELARFKRENRQAAMRDAADSSHPQVNEIDLRYRGNIPLKVDHLVTAAVVYQGKVKPQNQGRGLAYLAKEIKSAADINLIVDDDVQFDPSVLGYSMIYLVAEGAIKFSEAHVKALKGYLDHNGFLFLESCDETSKAAFVNLCVHLGMNLNPVTRDHPLLSEPHRFAVPPEGYEKDGTLLAGDGIVLSTYNYGRLWFGESAQGTPSRESIRSGMEWGVNLLTHLIETQTES
jgi:hypothetical protein